MRAALQATHKPYVIENVPGAPLHFPLLLCGSMFNLATPCGAQLRRHRLFESNLLLMAPGDCQHAMDTIGVHGHEFRNEATRYAERKGEVICLAGDHPHSPGRRKRTQRTIMVVGATARDPALERTKYKTIAATGSTPQQPVERDRLRETFTIKDAQIAMGIPWMPMRDLSQAIPPAYTCWIGQQLHSSLSARAQKGYGRLHPHHGSTTMKNDTRPSSTDPVKVARATLEEKRHAARTASTDAYALGQQAVEALVILSPASTPVTLDALMVTEMTALETTIGLLQREYETIMRTITRKREQLSLLQQYRATMDEEA